MVYNTIIVQLAMTSVSKVLVLLPPARAHKNDRMRACNLCKIRNQAEFTTNTKNSITHCVEISHAAKRARNQCSVLVYGLIILS